MTDQDEPETAHHQPEIAEHEAETGEPDSETAAADPDAGPDAGPDADPAADRRASAEETFGPLGKPLGKHSPFNIGFFGAVGVLVAIALKSVLVAASSVILLSVVALFLAVGLNPAVEFMTRHGTRRGVAVTAVFTAVLLALTLFGVAIVPVISEQVAAIVEATPSLIEDLKSNGLINRMNQRFDVLDRVSEQVQSGSFGAQLAGGVLDVGLAVLGALANTLIVGILTLYFLASLPKMKRNAYRLVPASRRDRVSSLGDEVLRRVGGYVGGAFVIAFLAGVTSLVFLFVVGLGKYAVALAFVVMLLDFIPLIGATIGAVIVSAIGLAVDPKIGLACIIFYVVYQQVENYLIYPRVMSSSVDVPGAMVMVAVLAGGALLGVIGALLAIPIAAGILLVTREVVIRRQDSR